MNRVKNIATAREYLRVSRDQSGRAKSPAQQHKENVRAVAARGWELVDDPYKDNDRSASRYARKQREDYSRMIDDLRRGDFKADVLVLWELSRGSRRVSEWTLLLDALADAGVKVYSTNNDKLFDPGKDGDYDDLLAAALDSQRESTKTSARIRRDVRASAAEGRPHGKKLYGYDRRYDEHTRELVEVVFNEKEAAVVREAGERVLAGETFYAIAKSLNERGVAPRRASFKDHRAGLGWTSVAIRQMLEMESYGGIRKHQSKRQGIDDRHDAIWPAMFDELTWRRLQDELSRRRTTDSNGNAIRPREQWDPKHLLTGIAVCGECGSIMRVGYQNAGRRKPLLGPDGEQLTWTRVKDGKRVVELRWEPRERYATYVCVGAPGRSGFHVAVKESLLDEAIEAAVVARLSRPDVLAALGQRDEGLDARRAELLDQIEAKRAGLDRFKAEARAKGMSHLIIDEVMVVQPEIDGLAAELESLVKTDPMVLDLVRQSDVAAAWEGLDIVAKRRVLKAVVTPVVAKMDPAKRGQRGLDLERITLRWH